MSKTKDISKFSTEQLQEFLMSFDVVMCDVDGVLWQFDRHIEGTSESLAKLQDMGKQIYLVTNNSTNGIEIFYDTLQHTGLKLSWDQIINSVQLMIWYLKKKINLRDEVLAIVSDWGLKIMKESGIQLTELPKVFEKDPTESVKEVLDRPSVKAVVVDYDIKCNWSKLALAISCLKRKDVLYLTGLTDNWLHSQRFPEIKILGPGLYVNMISTESGRKPISCVKPSQNLKDYIFDKCKVTDPQRCLFIGDMVDQDMKFASMCGFTKLFVGTGAHTLEQAQKKDDTCPEYYLPSLNQLFSAYNSQHTANSKDN